MSQTSITPLFERSDPAAQPAGAEGVRELMIVREIAHAFLNAERPGDVFQLALDRVAPLLDATLGCVYIRDAESDLMSLAASHRWPAQYAPFLSQMKVRWGVGPSGQAAAECRSIEVPDLAEDAALADWLPVGKELGFRSLVAIPLETRGEVLGTLTFYFAEVGAVGEETRQLLRIVADQLAATAEKALLIEHLQATNTALRDSNEELERQYLALVDARRAKDQFLANISHELRTPLTTVMGYVALMQDGMGGTLTAEQATALEAVSVSSRRLLGFIEDLLELTSLKQGVPTTTVTRFEVGGVLREVAEGAAPAPGVRLDVLDLPHAAIMAADRRAVVRILDCLLDNAVKFTPTGRIELSAGVTASRVRFTVRDTGIGIPADAQPRVFDEFHQVDSSATRAYGGSGVGLAVARRLARSIGGDILLTSTPAVGSTFIVELPLVHDATRSTPPRPTS